MAIRHVMVGISWTVLLLGQGAIAEAQCPDPIERVHTFPSDGASGVPLNVIPRVEYPSTHAAGGRPSWIIFYGSGSRVSGEATWDGSTAAFLPDADLEPRTAYYARVTDETSGEFTEFNFATGSGFDGGAPSFRGLSSLTWQHRSEIWLQESCSLWRGDGFVLELGFPEAVDDTPAEELCYYVFQTSGPGIDEELIVAATRRQGERLRLLLSDADGEGHVCYRMEVRDLAGELDGNSRERCVDPIVDQVFHNACTVAPIGTQAAEGVSLALLVAVAVLSFRRRRGR